MKQDARASDEELDQLRSRALVGVLSASLVHDLNNLLTPILIASARLAREVQNEKHAGMASLIEQCAVLAAGLSRDLMAVARPRVSSEAQVLVNDVVLGIGSLMERLLGEDISLTMSLDERVGRVLLDPKQLEHALLNLIINARDALVDGGRVTITSTLLDGENPRVALSVSDNGPGMTEEVREKAFDEFFTTKAGSGGLGLGLASVKRFVAEHKGAVSLESAPRQGTKVTMLFDRVVPAARTQISSTQLSAVKPSGERLLVVDRDERVRASVKLALEAAGYVVSTASSQDGALEHAAAEEIDVAVVDEQLLRRDQQGFLKRLRALRPNMRFVFMSDMTNGERMPDAVMTVLSKAFSEEELVRSVRHVLEPSSKSSRQNKCG